MSCNDLSFSRDFHSSVMPPGLKTLPWLIVLQESQPFIGMDGMQKEKQRGNNTLSP